MGLFLSNRKLVHGVGVNDANYSVTKTDNGRQTWMCPFYKRWKSMLKRCYSEKYHEKYPTYIDCTVFKEWLIFSNFKKWMESKDYIDKHLDKDLIEEGNKIYSPEKCLFLNQMVNKFMTSRKAARGELLLGVTWNKQRKKFHSQCKNPFTNKDGYLGLFTRELEAHKAWQKKKLEHAIDLSELHENKYLGDLLIKRYTFEENEICTY